MMKANAFVFSSSGTGLESSQYTFPTMFFPHASHQKVFSRSNCMTSLHTRRKEQLTRTPATGMSFRGALQWARKLIPRRANFNNSNESETIRPYRGDCGAKVESLQRTDKLPS